ncbi:hypothetical protein LTR36_000312 [Oleoguttula mirabilis]|uniref:Integral membrane protein, Mpv17/PMP22 family n=1 Tax=Oleoguttula mirabilis TaxID=1507867 RepID=A0AAV9JYS4_9PEZI|nr:hypothetical protein LTR36_000312 [Oleoguttula mirabilis]
MDSPIVKATLQAGALSGLSNIFGQLILCYRANTPYTIDPTQLAHFIIFSLLACPPNYIWQRWLETKFPGYTNKLSTTKLEKSVDDAFSSSRTGTFTNADGTVNKRTTSSDPDKGGAVPSNSVTTKKKLNLANTAIKFSLDQTIGAAANTVLFIAGIALLRGHTLPSIEQDVRTKFWPMIFAGQKLWPAVSVLSFTVVPFEHRTLFGSIVGLFWGIYLSLVSSGKK